MMRYANKMKLVPADTIDHKFVGIDQELYNILTNKNLSTDAKTNHYNQIINRAVKKSPKKKQQPPQINQTRLAVVPDPDEVEVRNHGMQTDRLTDDEANELPIVTHKREIPPPPPPTKTEETNSKPVDSIVYIGPRPPKLPKPPINPPKTTAVNGKKTRGPTQPKPKPQKRKQPYSGDDDIPPYEVKIPRMDMKRKFPDIPEQPSITSTIKRPKLVQNTNIFENDVQMGTLPESSYNIVSNWSNL